MVVLLPMLVTNQLGSMGDPFFANISAAGRAGGRDSPLSLTNAGIRAARAVHHVEGRRAAGGRADQRVRVSPVLQMAVSAGAFYLAYCKQGLAFPDARGYGKVRIPRRLREGLQDGRTLLHRFNHMEECIRCGMCMKAARRTRN